jgi:hypothetical protein
MREDCSHNMGGEQRERDCGWAYYESPGWKIVIGLYKSLRVPPFFPLLLDIYVQQHTYHAAQRTHTHTHTHTQTHINFFDLTAVSRDTIYTPDLSLWFTRSSQYIFQATFFFISNKLSSFTSYWLRVQGRRC